MMVPILDLLMPPLAALLLSLLLIPAARREAMRLRFVDRPGGRKAHERPVPPVGGLVIFPIFVAVGLASGWRGSEELSLYAAIGILLITGVIDDHRVIAAKLKFLIHMIAALIVVIPGGAELHNLGNLFGWGDIHLGWASVPFSVFCVMLLINAINLIDGLDGLAGGKGVVVTVWLMVCMALGGQTQMVSFTAILTFALIGFLVFNMRHPFRKRAAIFMGDSGSMALGLVLAWFSIRIAQPPYDAVPPVVVAWILSWPVIDAFAQFVNRVRQGRHPFDPDRNHLHHHFISAGFSPGAATASILVAAFVNGLIGVAGYFWLELPSYVLMYGWVALLALHTVIIMRSGAFVALLSKVTRHGR